LENRHIRAGLTLDGVRWAFTHVHSQNWHPLTSISHMVDCQLFGVRPGAHHFINVLLHSAAVILLFLVLQQMTGGPSRTDNLWASAFVAAVFAIHPLRVESVAWVAERKDVLSGIFFMLTIGAYVRYVRRQSAGRFVTMSILFACGLMSKPMLVTVPIVLLLIDYWPLNRGQKFLRLVIEKIPLVALSIAAVVATLLAQNFALGSTEMLPLKWRITNAIVTYFDYVWHMFWPRDLIPFYIHPEGRLEIWRLVLASAVLVLISSIAIVRRRQNPYLIVGWLWYLVMLVPVIGIVQVGLQGRADRYTYLPQIGLYIALAWLVRDLTASWRKRAIVLAPAAVAVVATLSILSWKQAAHWRDTETLWSYTLNVTPDSDVAHTGLAGILFVRGQVDEAIAHYRRAIALRSGNSGAQHGLATALAQQRKVDEAIEHYRKALELQPDNIEASNALALLLVHRGDYAEAIAQWQNSLRYEPDDGNAANNLAWVLATADDPQLRDPSKAVQLAQRANRSAQDVNAVVLRTLAVAYAANRQFTEAIATAERGAQVAEASGQNLIAADLRRYIDKFKRGQPPVP
ncbi:MAG: tetratricopeptide repeat protein, partial [Verrucomicrobiota bacterium]|nr:tetratricopeptide repeat protein [Verrucomicrobiota bacterium]